MELERGYPSRLRSPIPAGAGRYPGDKGAPGHVLILKSILKHSGQYLQIRLLHAPVPRPHAGGFRLCWV